MKKKEIIIEYILNNIKKGTWKKGKRILSEADIANYNNVSRNTVREAIQALIYKGVLEQRRGSGTYVTEDFSNKKYVIILYADFFFKEIIGSSYRIIIEELKEKLENNNLTPVLVEYGKEKFINIDINEIGAIIKMEQIYSALEIIGKKNNIPIIQYGDDNTIYSSVKNETILQFVYLRELIEKYNLKNLVIFSKEFDNMDHISTSIYMLYHYYFKEKGYKLIVANNTANMSNGKNVIKKGLKSIEEIPDAIVFLDDNLYKSGYEIFPLFDKILSQTKIITFSNGNELYNPKYKVCKIAFDLNEIANKMYNLTYNCINNIPTIEKNVIVKPYIIDEENLKD